MNIGTLLAATSSQPTSPDGQGSMTANEDTPGIFGQVLATMTAGPQSNQAQAVPNALSGAALTVALLKVFGQKPNPSDPALDLLQEAPMINDGEQETPVTLTEIMTALQSVVNESTVESPVVFPLGGEADQKPQEETKDETLLAVLGRMAGFAPIQPISAFPQAPSSEIVTPEVATEVCNRTSAWTQLTIQETSEDNRKTSILPDVSGRMTVGAHQSESVAVPVGTIPNGSASEQTVSFTQTLANQAVQASKTQEMGSQVTKPVTTDDSIPQAKVNTLMEGLATLPQAELFNSQSSTFNVQLPTAETPMTLPDIPALHQLVEKVSLITRQGETEVRLHLQPESLGQVLIQLHFADDDVSVRMLTQTAQAHNLIQEHLSQLKAAFTAQGLHMNNLAVAIGSDASAFDRYNRQSNDWPQESAHQQTSSGHLEVDTAVSARPAPVTRSGWHIVDYQV